MKFAVLFSLKENVTQAKILESAARRREFKFPEGVKLLEEYWTPVQSPAVIALFEATDPAALMLNSIAWVDTFEVQVVPIVEYKEGLDKVAKLAAAAKK